MLTAEQLEERRSGIGGSDAAAAVGLSPHRTSLSLYLEKRGEIEPDDLSDNEAVHFGHVLEAIVAEEFTRRTGLTVRRQNKTLHHPERPWQLAHIDRRITGRREGLEIKTAGAFTAKDWDDVPPAVLIQCAHYMAVTGFDRWHVAVLIGGRGFRTYEIPADAELIERLNRREAEFWRCVEEGIPPPPQTTADLALLYPEDSGAVVEATSEAEQAYAELCNVNTQLAELSDQKKTLEYTLKAGLGEGAILTDHYGETLATFKAQTARRLDQKALKADHPELFEKYRRESVSRVLRIR